MAIIYHQSTIRGSPGGLARIDKFLHSSTYTTAFSNSPQLGSQHTVDTLVSVLTICSIPEPERTVNALVNDVLKPGGTLLFYEHVLSDRPDVAWWQRFWTPLWSRVFDGCRLDRPTHLWIEKMDVWAEKRIWGREGEQEGQLVGHPVAS
ncbi:hypothetical protein OH77DRAFT_1588519 [Trametes cingulata]|nr:hypothetical protein OH77DRAFT_1588519 [Trametes cingulata]